jgi:hypothetical protein
MASVFYRTRFDIGNWNVGAVTTMVNMFSSAILTMEELLRLQTGTLQMLITCQECLI